jgi:hypothetical protein
MIAVIPAGGRASRFMGIHKDMLPIGDGRFLLTEAMARARLMGADRCVVVTSAEKAAMHERLLSRDDTLLVSTDRGLWAAIEQTFVFNEASLLILPDTVFTPVAAVPRAPLAFGTFATDEPHRFSAISGDTIITKQPGPPAQAWGCVAWGVGVIAFWRGKEYAHYDDAFRDAMAAFSFATFPIKDYHDLGDWASYRRFIVEA